MVSLVFDKQTLTFFCGHGTSLYNGTYLRSMKRVCLGLLTFLCLIGAGVDDARLNDFRSPLGIPLNLAGNFGEFRSNHFHTGIDIKTEGREGLDVFASADGFVSRIKISPYGYGNALYITHPNGYTTVYAHLSELDPVIDHFVKQAQYEFESFAVDLYPGEFQLPVVQGQVIAKSGNSGSSGGPHLHFEVRETDTEFPINPLLWDFEVEDTRAPLIYELLVYPVGENASVNGNYGTHKVATRNNSGKCTLINQNKIKVAGEVSLGIHTLDFLNNNANKCGIFELEVYLDDSLFYLQRMDQLDFSKGRMMNTHLDYKAFKEDRKSIHRAFQLPSNRLPIYKNIKGNGTLSLKEGEEKAVKIIARDVHGNASSLNFILLGDALKSRETDVSPQDSLLKKFKYNQVNAYRTENCNLFIPENRLYEDAWMKVECLDSAYNEFGGLFQVGEELVPLDDYVLIKLKAPELDSLLMSKLTVVSCRENGSSPRALGGQEKMAWVSVRTKNFGYYYLDIDTTAPNIRFLDSSKEVFSKGEFNLRVTDDLSGIQNFNAYYNGQWVLMNYDPKRNYMWGNFKDFLNTETKQHELKVVVEDERGNVQTELLLGKD